MDDVAASRRRFLGSSSAAVMGAWAAGCASGAGGGPPLDQPPAPADGAAPTAAEQPAPEPVRAPVGRLVVSTWRFGRAANAAAWAAFEAGVEHPVDACVAGVQVTEADPSVHTVGLGGRPNADGVVELDAAVMRGEDLGCGAVAGLQRVLHPVAVARDVMRHTKEVLLVGDGALQFARGRGHAEGELLTAETREAWEAWSAHRTRSGAGPEDHDTIGMITLDAGRFGMAVTTSGRAYKLPGRVGDSPIVGAGGYCDDAAGACVASGDGEEMLRLCASFSVVQALRHGATLEEAFDEVFRRSAIHAARRGERPYVGLLAVDRDGRVAAMASGTGFQYALTDDAGTRLVDAEVFRG